MGDLRRRGVGRRLSELARDTAVSTGRTALIRASWRGGVGAPFALAMGTRLVQEEIRGAPRLSDVDGSMIGVVGSRRGGRHRGLSLVCWVNH
ncbi:MAG TPA: hypothetical protein VLJ59_07685 [Mycobacteriales bacterium]|nr:hypothetical protein [Mycobacteriales bacterium]